MLEWVNTHGLLCLVLYYLFSSGVGAMPTPAPGGSGLYEWLYHFTHNFLQLLAANASRLPSVRGLVGINSGEQPAPKP